MKIFSITKNIVSVAYIGLFISISICLGAIILTSCATTSGISGRAAVVEGPDGYRQESRVIIDNWNLAHCIKIAELKSDFVGDLMKASVSLVSKKNEMLNLQYKFIWYTAHGIEIDSESSPWLPLIIYGKETKQVHSVAPNPSAKEFKIELRFKEL